MDTTTSAVIVAGVTLLFNVSLHLFGGGWRMSSRLTSMETTLKGVQEELANLSRVLIEMANLRGEFLAISGRIGRAEEDIRELRHGDGFVRGTRGLDKEYP